MKKIVILLAMGLFVFTGVNNASALVYEYYEGYQSTQEGETYDFYFDLVNENAYSTNSSLALVNDVAVGEAALPFRNAYVQIDLYSTDLYEENVLIQLMAYHDGQEYELYNGSFNGCRANGEYFSSTYDISDTSFLYNPYGEISITATITGLGNNNFGIKQVGIGGEPGPVPEPATLFLLGAGLTGLAGIGRKKLK